MNVLKETLTTFNSTGQFNLLFFGVRYRLIPRETALLNDVPEGAYVATVVPNSSAAEAGVTQGDIITKFDGKLLKEFKVDLQVWLRKRLAKRLRLRYGETKKSKRLR